MITCHLTKKCSGADGQSFARFGRFGCSEVCFAGNGLWFLVPVRPLIFGVRPRGSSWL